MDGYGRQEQVTQQRKTLRRLELIESVTESIIEWDLKAHPDPTPAVG